MAAWHLCVESWLLCTPSLPPAVGAGWGETGQSHLLQGALFSPPQGTPGRCGLQAKPKGERQRRALSRLPRHLCPGAVTELAAQVFRRAGTGRSPPWLTAAAVTSGMGGMARCLSPAPAGGLSISEEPEDMVSWQGRVGSAVRGCLHGPAWMSSGVSGVPGRPFLRSGPFSSGSVCAEQWRGGMQPGRERKPTPQRLLTAFGGSWS